MWNSAWLDGGAGGRRNKALIMKLIAIFTLCLCVLAVPCLYNATSTEPAPLAALFANMDVGNPLAFQPPTQDKN
jgi:hypothetical protein